MVSFWRHVYNETQGGCSITYRTTYRNNMPISRNESQEGLMLGEWKESNPGPRFDQNEPIMALDIVVQFWDGKTTRYEGERRFAFNVDTTLNGAIDRVIESSQYCDHVWVERHAFLKHSAPMGIGLHGQTALHDVQAPLKYILQDKDSLMISNVTPAFVVKQTEKRALKFMGIFCATIFAIFFCLIVAT